MIYCFHYLLSFTSSLNVLLLSTETIVDPAFILKGINLIRQEIEYLTLNEPIMDSHLYWRNGSSDEKQCSDEGINTFEQLIISR